MQYSTPKTTRIKKGTALTDNIAKLHAYDCYSVQPRFAEFMGTVPTAIGAAARAIQCRARAGQQRIAALVAELGTDDQD